MIVLGERRIHAGVQPLNSHVAPSVLNARDITVSVCNISRQRYPTERGDGTDWCTPCSVHDLRATLAKKEERERSRRTLLLTTSNGAQRVVATVPYSDASTKSSNTTGEMRRTARKELAKCSPKPSSITFRFISEFLNTSYLQMQHDISEMEKSYARDTYVAS